jgi:LPS sulfotransferase NodH
MNQVIGRPSLFVRLGPHDPLGAWDPITQLSVERGYIVAASPRTGSTLLCEGLSTTGVAGRPIEPFVGDQREAFCRQWNLPSDIAFTDFLRAVVRNGTTANGMFGVKIHWSQMIRLATDLIAAGQEVSHFRDILLQARYIQIRRRDRRAQAISLFRALATKRFWQVEGVVNHTATGAEPEFDASEIRRLEFMIELETRSWAHFFAEHNIAPLIIEYESLHGQYREQIGRALAHLGLDPTAAASLPAPRLQRQSDEKSRLWARWLNEEDALAR